MITLTVRQKIAVLVLLIFLTIGGVLIFIKGNSGASSKPNPAPTSLTKALVHVCGAVVRPNVYELALNARKIDAIRIAGGELPEADLSQINLAAVVEDGEQIYVPRKGETSPKQVNQRNKKTPKPTKSPRPTKTPKPTRTPKHTPEKTPKLKLTPSAKPLIIASPGADTSAVSPSQTKNDQYPLNLNTASREQLERLPGIGPSLAERIIQYRTAHGGFQSVEELDKVSGIGQSKLEKLRPYVSVQ